MECHANNEPWRQRVKTSTLSTNAQDRLILQHQDWWIRPKQKQIPPPAACYDDVTHEVDVQHAIND